MFDIDGSGAVPGIPLPVPDDPAQSSWAPVPLERLEAQICELAGHLAAATCRFLVLLGDFDADSIDWIRRQCDENAAA